MYISKIGIIEMRLNSEVIVMNKLIVKYNFNDRVKIYIV